MSFSYETKKELSKIEVTENSCIVAQSYGMVIFAKSFSERNISHYTSNPFVASCFMKNLASIGVIAENSTKLTAKKGDKVYNLSVPLEDERKKIIHFFGYTGKETTLRINISNLYGDDTIRAFLRGVFLSCGSVTDPKKDYHIEFVTNYLNLAKDLVNVITMAQELYNIEPRIINRKGNFIVYVKGGENISDLLAYMGASMASLECIQERMVKEVKNKVTRIVNSETANSNKTAAAAVKQLNAITCIKETKGLDFLTDDLKELAELRIQNPEMNLRELGNLLNVPISRSGVNHRFERIIEIAEEISKEKLHINNNDFRSDKSGN